MFLQFRPALVLFTLLAILTGLLYPLTVTGIAQAFFREQANGSLIEQNGTLVGSALIGQEFTDPRYFWPRPSMTTGSPYTPFDERTLTGSSGSNLGPLSQTLVNAVQERVEALQSSDPDHLGQVPSDLVTASASGLDPHISIQAAFYQALRVARSRGMSEADVNALIDQYCEGRTFGVLGEPRVNVLLLNLALDALK